MREVGHFIGGKHVAGQLGPHRRRLPAHDRRGAGAGSRWPPGRGARGGRERQGRPAAWAATNPQRRARVMMKFLELIATRRWTTLAELLAREHGKTIADAKGDIQRGVEVVEFACGIPHLLKGEYTEGAGPGIDIYSMRQPLGVVAGITPFNFPAMIPLWKLRARPSPAATPSSSSRPSAIPACRCGWPSC